MKKYPVDRWAPVMFLPMLAAQRARSRVLKAALVLLYPPWFVLLMPVTAVLLLVSVALAAWDSVNGQ